MKLIQNSLLSKLVTYFSLLSLVSVTTVATTAYIFSKNALKESVLDRLSVAASIKDDAIDQWFNIQRQDVLLSANLPEVQAQAGVLVSNDSSEEQSKNYLIAYDGISQYFADLAAIKPNMREISILTNDGQVVFSTNKTLEGKYQPLGATTTYFTRNQTDFKPIFYTSSITGKTVITFATEILDRSNKPIGAIAITLDLQEVDNLIRERTGLGKTGETYLVGRLESKNTFIASDRSDSEKYPRGVSSFGIDNATKGNYGTGLYLNYDGVPVIGVYHWLDKQNLALLAEINQQEAFAPARRLAKNILLIGLSSSGVLLMVVYLLSHQITKPILAIADAAKQLADGKLSHKVPVLSSDEIGVLARSFNQMAQQLEDSFTALEQTNQNLEYRVEESTAELAKAKEAAEVANVAKCQFLTNISHDLRTPLNSIIGYAKMLQKDRNLKFLQIQSLRIVHQSGTHLLNLINDILDFSKIEAKKMKLEPRNFDLPNLLEEVTGTIRMLAIEKNLLFKYEAIGNLPTGIQADDKRLRQVLLNLLGNGIKFTDTGQVKLKVSLINEVEEKSNPRHANICFEVIDTGVGMSPQQLKQIFQPFEQVAHTQRQRSGAGLGLAICKQLVELMGGGLEVKSQLGKGSIFKLNITVPIVELVEKGQEDLDLNVLGYKGSKRIILVVDDQKATRSILRDILKPLGFQVVMASNGKEGLEIATSIRPDLILTDVFMPVKNGFGMVQELRQILEMKNLPIIGITASTSEEINNDNQFLGFEAILPKPFDENKLLALLQKHLHLEWVFEEVSEQEKTEASVARQT